MGRPRGLLTYLSVLFAGGVVAVALPALAAGSTRAAAPPIYAKHNARVVGDAVVNFKQLARLERLHGHAGPARPAAMPEPQEIAEPNMRKLTLPSPFGTMLLAGSSLSNVPSPSPAQSFIAQADAPRPSSGFSYIPPDTNGAVGASKIMSTLNSNYVVEDKSTGAVIGSVVGMDTFWNAAGATAPFDPKIYYDPYNQRWIVAAVDAAGTANSAVLYGVSDSSDPSGTWHLYKIDADAGNTNWADYPGVGFNKNVVVITVNMFHNSDNAYEGHAKVYALNYPSLRSGTNGSPKVTSIANAFTIQPAVTDSATENTLYMVEHGSSASGTYYFYTVDSTGTVAGGTTALTNSLGGWVIPGSANVLPQLGGHGIDAGDSRILNAVFRNGDVYYAQTIGLGGSNGNPARTAAQWVEVNTSGAFVQGGRIVDPTATSSNAGHWYAYPSIAVNKNNDVMVGFSEFASNHYPNAAYAVHMSADPAGTMRDPVTLKAGEGNYFKQFNGSRNRWGDYSATQVDPADDTAFWTTQEYSRPTPAGCSSTGTITCGAWGTWWGKVLGGSAPPPVHYTLNVSKAGTGAGLGTVTGNGINCGSICSASFAVGTVVTLTQSHPVSNSTFGGWNGDCSGIATTCQVTMNGNKAVVATFYQQATPPACRVPKVIGKKLAVAKTKIRAAHCKVGKVSYARSTKRKKGRVLKQSPRAGSRRANGAKVKLVVGKGPRH